MQGELPKQYDPSTIEDEIYRRWLANRAFSAVPDHRDARYVVMMPLPNVTGALHMGHAMDNVMQDLLTRWHRLRGDNTLWQPGTDHAGIATQAIVEKRLLEIEGKTRHDIGREALVQRIWEWKDQYQARIIRQQQAMGCSCDWDRERFTMDSVCARAVHWTFFNMFRDGLIYRGNRLVNWDCHLQTAVSDDEIYHETVQGHFWHLRYPIIDPAPGEPDHVVVATTRPETMLGDTAVACHPDPTAGLEQSLAELRRRLDTIGDRDRPALEAELERLERRRTSHLPGLVRLAEMARAGRKVLLPLVDRQIPLITDAWAKPELGSGCVKITPAHDPNDHDVWTRHRDEIDIINILRPDGTLNENAGPYEGLDRYDARDRLVADLKDRGLLPEIEDREVEIGFSDRSKTAVEPYLSRQWFVRMGDMEGGVLFGAGTEREFRAPGLAQAAIDAASEEWTSASGRQLRFHPDPVRYGNTYRNWLAEKRDWCISRQLWWGHRIPIWSGMFGAPEAARVLEALAALGDRDDVCAWIVLPDGTRKRFTGATGEADLAIEGEDTIEILVCVREDESAPEVLRLLEKRSLRQDPDVLDTWFSSGLWPHSTLGWPDPATAAIGPGETPLGPRDGAPDSLSYYYPGSCLVTGRDIITLWVARMVVMGLYNLGDVPFTDVFIHATILDGKGERMSKSKGNGIDPADIIAQYGADAMRYVLCEMQTGMQDIRLPVQAISPFTGNPVDLATARHGQSIFTYICPESGKEFDVLGTMENVPSAKLVSDRFEVGRNFCNKVWNAARFALLNLEGVHFEPRKRDELFDEDRWILSRLSRAIATVHDELERYNPSAAVGAAREFFWSELCDWYVELIKPRLRHEEQAAVARQILAAVMDQILRLLHPFVPFVTEALWARLAEIAPSRGVDRPLDGPELLISAQWPAPLGEHRDSELEDRFRFFQEVVRAVRDIRARYSVPPRRKIPVAIRARGASADGLRSLSSLISSSAGIENLEIASGVQRSRDAAAAIVRDVEIYVAGVVDIEKERADLGKQREQLTGRIEGARRKLANENFVTRAKPEVVERERERVVELEAELARLEGLLADLD